MSEVDRIRQQMAQAFEGVAWHGPSVTEILADVTADVAAARPVAGVHSIWEIVLHLIATQTLLLDRVQGKHRELTPDEDWPPVPEPSQAAWRDTLDRLQKGDAAMREAVGGFADERLGEPLVPGGSSAYNNFHGYVQHNLYHAAQIGVLKKLSG